MESIQKQIIDRYVAKKAIYKAMTEGRHISLYDSAEFQVSQMHTMVCQIRKDIKDKNLPYTLQSKWVEPYGRRVKVYWLEPREA